MQNLFAYWTLEGTPNASFASCHGTDKPPSDRPIPARLWIVRVENKELYLLSTFEVSDWTRDKNRVIQHMGGPIPGQAKKHWYALAAKPERILKVPITHLADTLELKHYRNGRKADQLDPRFQFNLRPISCDGARLLEQEWTRAVSASSPQGGLNRPTSKELHGQPDYCML